MFLENVALCYISKCTEGENIIKLRVPMISKSKKKSTHALHMTALETFDCFCTTTSCNFHYSSILNVVRTAFSSIWQQCFQSDK